MPLLIKAVVPDTPEPPDTEQPREHEVLGITWTPPVGDPLDISCHQVQAGVWLQAGAAGWGAAPRAINRQPLAAGGTTARWSHVDERIITLPLAIQEQTVAAQTALRRQVTRSFLTTAPPAAPPRPGVLRLTRDDGTWREVAAIYLEGLTGEAEGRYRRRAQFPVVNLVCPDPWWYGPELVAVEFVAIDTTRNYLNPYETVSPDTVLGEQPLTVQGDAPASPTWIVTGPADSVTAGLVGGPSWTLGTVATGEVLTIDTETWTVTDEAGVSHVDRIDWAGGSTLWQLPAGDITINVDITGASPGPPPSSVRLVYRPRFEVA